MFGAGTLSESGGFWYVSFSLDVYLCEYKGVLYTERLAAMLLNDAAETFYDAGNGLDRDTALGAWTLRWTHWSGCGAVPQNNDIRYENTPFIRCEEKYSNTSRPTAIIG